MYFLIGMAFATRFHELAGHLGHHLSPHLERRANACGDILARCLQAREVRVRGAARAAPHGLRTGARLHAEAPHGFCFGNAAGKKLFWNSRDRSAPPPSQSAFGPTGYASSPAGQPHSRPSQAASFPYNSLYIHLPPIFLAFSLYISVEMCLCLAFFQPTPLARGVARYAE